MTEQDHTPPISLVVPLYNEGEASEVTALPANRDNTRVAPTVRNEFMCMRSASRTPVAER